MARYSDCSIVDYRQDYRDYTLTTWYDLIPVFGIVVTIAGISLKAGMIIQKLDNVIDDVKDIKGNLKDIDRRLTILETMGIKD